MSEEGPLTIAQLDAIDEQNKAVLDQAVDFAKASPLPPAEDLYTDVYVSNTSAT